MTATSRPYQGTSAKDRIEERRQRLLDTAFDAMAEDAWKNMSINQLCREAGLTKRYFYESFSNLDDLADAVTGQLASKVIALALTAAAEGTQAGLSNLEVARKVMNPVLGYLTDEPRRARVLFGEAADNPVARSNRRKVINALAYAVNRYGHEHYETHGKTDPITILTSSILVGGTIEAILNWLEGGIEMNRQQFIDDVAELWVVNADATAAIARRRN